MNAPDELEVEVELELELELVAPPPMNCPTAPLMLAMVPFAGAVKTAAERLFCADWTATCAPVTGARAASSSGWVGLAMDDAKLACCDASPDCAVSIEFCAVCNVAFCCAFVL